MLVIPCCLLICLAGAQNYSNKGTDFWVGYGAHSSMYNADGTINNTDGGSQEMVLYFSATVKANVTVEIPATGWTKNYTVNPNSFTQSDPIPKKGANDARIDTEGISDNGIHITSDQPVLAYCHIYDDGSSASSLLFPTNTLGQDYVSLNFTQNSDKPASYSYCFIIATEDNTVVQVIPSENTQSHKGWTPFTQTLQKGQVLNLFGKSKGKIGNQYSGADLTGTRITTVSNGGVCKKIAVFSGSSSISINCNPNVSSTSDNLIQQVLPNGAKGKEYALVPSKDMSDNIYRILVPDTSAIVMQNGIVLTHLINKKYYQIQTDKPTIIKADKNIFIAQYITSANACGNNIAENSGDPEMTYLTPVNENFTSAVINSTNNFNIISHYINIVKKASDLTSATLDGAPIENDFKRFLFDTNYAYAQIKVDLGIHQLHADSGFSAIAYGYGNFESYSYNLGFNNNVSDSLSIQNPYSNPDNLETCNATPFKIAVNLSYRPIQLTWDFYNNPQINSGVNITEKLPLYDSAFDINKKTYYRYSLPGLYSTNEVKNLPLKLIATRPTEDGCIDSAEYDYTIKVFEKPNINWALHDNSCLNDSLHFIDGSDGFSRQLIKWNWDFGNGDTSCEQNPAEVYTNPGNYNIRLRSINDIGCYSDIIKPVFVSSKPAAAFNISGANCIGNNSYLSDESTIGTGNIVKWIWNLGDGTISSAKNLIKQYQYPDTFTIKLLVYNAQNCASDTAVKQWPMYSYPKIITPTDLFTEKNAPVIIKPEYEGKIHHYTWSPSLYLNSDTIAYPISIPASSIIYQETVTGDGGCTASGNVYIDVIQYLQIPNAFSPNGDGINDTWVIGSISRYTDASVQVFDRSGQSVFISNGYYHPWNGTKNGKLLPVGTYYYIINPRDKYMPVSSGYVTILR